MSETRGLAATVKEFAAGLRFPTLFFLTATLFVVDLCVPDFIPVADEILLALGTLLLGSLRKGVRQRLEASEKPAQF
ncbi:MAG: DUF6116 family protein [Pirellulales bacterium]